MKILKVSEIVKKILTTDIDSRDNDELLIIKVWKKQNPKASDPRYYFSQFTVDFITGQFSKPESIRRSRQRLQELNPELRGRFYKHRHEHTSKVKEEIKSIK